MAETLQQSINGLAERIAASVEDLVAARDKGVYELNLIEDEIKPITGAVDPNWTVPTLIDALLKLIRKDTDTNSGTIKTGELLTATDTVKIILLLNMLLYPKDTATLKDAVQLLSSSTPMADAAKMEDVCRAILPALIAALPKDIAALQDNVQIQTAGTQCNDPVGLDDVCRILLPAITKATVLDVMTAFDDVEIIHRWNTVGDLVSVAEKCNVILEPI